MENPWNKNGKFSNFQFQKLQHWAYHKSSPNTHQYTIVKQSQAKNETGKTENRKLPQGKKMIFR